MNDLPHFTDFAILSTYADDTQIFYARDNVTDVEHAINSDLGKIDKWYEENELSRNHDKYKAMVMGDVTRPFFQLRRYKYSSAGRGGGAFGCYGR